MVRKYIRRNPAISNDQQLSPTKSDYFDDQNIYLTKYDDFRLSGRPPGPARAGPPGRAPGPAGGKSFFRIAILKCGKTTGALRGALKHCPKARFSFIAQLPSRPAWPALRQVRSCDRLRSAIGAIGNLTIGLRSCDRGVCDRGGPKTAIGLRSCGKNCDRGCDWGLRSDPAIGGLRSDCDPDLSKILH